MEKAPFDGFFFFLFFLLRLDILFEEDSGPVVSDRRPGFSRRMLPFFGSCGNLVKSRKLRKSPCDLSYSEEHNCTNDNEKSSIISIEKFSFIVLF